MSMRLSISFAFAYAYAIDLVSVVDIKQLVSSTEPISKRVLDKEVSYMTQISLENLKVSALPTVKPGNQMITIVNCEETQDDKGARWLLTFSCDNGATFSRMFFLKSMTATTFQDGRDRDFNNMLLQLGTNSASEAFAIGTTYLANVQYGTDRQGYTNVYPNILGSKEQPKAQVVQEDITLYEESI